LQNGLRQSVGFDVARMIAMTQDSVITDLETRAASAQARYGQFASSHEAIGVALEEWPELIDAIRSNDDAQTEHEAIDLAAVLIRLARACRNDAAFQGRSRK
jgi:NTP pyrophosphatase (non-canonical NTP hydrolase)